MMLIFKIIFLLQFLHGYLQIPLAKRVLPRHVFPKIDCSTDKSNKQILKTALQQYKMPCFPKDITYVAKFKYYQKQEQLLFLSFDPNIPISWIKSQQCQIHDVNMQKIGDAQLINYQEQNRFEQAIDKLKKKLKNTKKQQHKLDQLSKIQGSGSIFGQVQKNHSLHLKTRDSNRFSSIINIISAGLFLSNEFKEINIQKTQYMQAYSINFFQSQIHDGVLSLIDVTHSFLQQILAASNSGRVLTIWLNPQKHTGMMTFGQMSIKNVQGGISNLKYINFTQLNNSLSIQSIHLYNSDQDKIYDLSRNMQPIGIFSMQVSYIGLPEHLINNFLKKISKLAQCNLSESQFVQCNILDKQFFKFKINFLFQQEDNSFNFQIQQLIQKKQKSKKGKYVTLKILKTQNFVIFGQPFFEKYFIAFDYSKSRIAFGPSRRTFGQKLFKTITFVRLIVIIFVIGIFI